MRNAKNIKAEIFRALLSGITAHAEEGAPEPTPAPQVNYEDLVARARQEEKNKLYPKIQKLEEDVRKGVEINNSNLIKIGDLTKANENLTAELNKYKSGEINSDEITKLNTRITELTAELETAKNSQVNEAEIRKQIEAEYEIKDYLREQKTANKDSILDSFMSQVGGNTKEEIDASIQTAKQSTLAVKKELGLVDEDGNLIEQPKKKSEENKKPKAPTPKATNPVDDSTKSKQYDIAYIQSLDPRSEEYREFRKSIGLQ